MLSNEPYCKVLGLLQKKFSDMFVVLFDLIF